MFTHLHTHTQYSLLDGSNKITEYVSRVKELGMDSAAITDHGVMYGVIDFYKECQKQGIRPVIGCEVYVAPGSRFDKEAHKGEDKYFHLILLAENNEGYQNLMKIVSAGFTEGYYYKPRVDEELLRKYNKGLICLSACVAGQVQRLVLAGDYEGAKKAALNHLEIFGEGNYFLEIQDHGLRQEKIVSRALIKMSRETGIPLAATNDCHYTYDRDADAHDILLCLQTGKHLSDEDRMVYAGGQYYVKSEEEMRSLFPEAPEAIENTYKIARRCNVEIRFHEPKLPLYDTPSEYTASEYLEKLCEEGFKERYPEGGAELLERLSYELSVINDMGYVDYFLIVWDFIRYARQNGIAVGPGRGSAAGSMVAYCLHITDIDPIRFNLVFERFLNPERVSMPDIDVDFCVDRRGEVIDYVMDKYGRDHVVQIVTFGTMAARGVIRDVGRVMDLPYGFVDKVAKTVPRELNITLERALKTSPDLRGMYESDENIKRLIDMSMRLEGLPRNSSMHAAGVVISRDPMVEALPLSRAQDGTITTQFNMTTVEELGLLKMDFLGLRNLTVIQHTLKMIEKTRGIVLDTGKIDFTEKDVYDMICQGKTLGVFQLESPGMTSFMRELSPTCLEDIIAGIALYRPGPMDFIPAYIKGKKNADSITYKHPALEPILAETYGCIVYQEQVMQIVRDLAGYSWGRSDLVRRAMSKKKADVMEGERKNFVHGNPDEGVDGCLKRGISEDVANSLFDEMTDFASYAFNKSHAAAYAVVAYQTAYLKCKYPVEYMACLLSSEMTNSTKLASYIAELKDMDIELMPPDVNSGQAGFSVEDGRILYGLEAVRTVGSGVARDIAKEREDNGKYKSLSDFCQRLLNSQLNKRMVESLIKSGAFDCLGGTRKQYMYAYTAIMDETASSGKDRMEGQMSMMDFLEDDAKEAYAEKLPEVGEFDKETLLMFEKEMLGVYVSGHPLDDYAKRIAGMVTARAVDFMLDEETMETSLKEGAYVTAGGLVAACNIKVTKRGDQMAFVTLEDLTGTLEVIVFANQFSRARNILEEDAKIFVTGRVSEDANGSQKLIAEKIISFDDMPKEVWIRCRDEKEYVFLRSRLESMIQRYPGKDGIVIYLENEKKMRRLSNPFYASDESVERLREICGRENVAVK